MSEFFESMNPVVRDCVWQTTVILVLGIACSRVFTKAPSKAFYILLATVGACLTIPMASWGARQLNLGMLPDRADDSQIPNPIHSYSFSGEPEIELANSSLEPTVNPSPQFDPSEQTTRKRSFSSKLSTDVRSIELSTVVKWIWALASLLIILRFLQSLLAGRRLISRSRAPDDRSIEQALNRSTARLNVNATPRLLLSGEIQCPVIWCWDSCPVILVPQHLAHSTESLDWESLFCHELAHWKRKDHLTSLLVECALAVFPWHPLIWWSRTQLNHLRENVCDDWVIYCGRPDALFADTLLNLVPLQRYAAVFPAASHRRSTKTRIRRILNPDREPPFTGGIWRYSTLFGLVCAVISLSLFHKKSAVAETGKEPSPVVGNLAASAESKPSVESFPSSANTRARRLQIGNVDFVDEVSLSPNGKWLAGANWDEQLTLINTATGERRDVEESLSMVSPVVWSSDGSEIAFVQSVSPEESFLKAYSQENDSVRLLMNNPPTVISDWSSDGNMILGSRYEEETTVLIRLSDKSETILSNQTGYRTGPIFSNDDRFILFVSQESDQSVLHIRKTDGTDKFEYGAFPGEMHSPQWSPEGDDIVFVGEQQGVRETHRDLWSLTFDGKTIQRNPVPIRSNIDQEDFGNWTRDGRLLYRRKFNLGGLFTLTVDPKNGSTRSVPKRLFRSKKKSTTFCWSRDSQQIAAFSDGHIVVVSARTGTVIKELKVPEIKIHGRGIAWSPDGKTIALSGFNTHREAAVYLVDMNDGSTEQLVKTENFMDATWSPNGKKIAYGNVSIIDLETKESTKLAQGRRPYFSPDGKSVAYMTGDNPNTVMTTTIDGRHTEELFRIENEEAGSVNIFGWAPNGRYIVFTPGTDEIWAVKVPGGKPYKLADLPKQQIEGWAWFPRWSPDGKTIAFGATYEHHQYWVMENFISN